MLRGRTWSSIFATSLRRAHSSPAVNSARPDASAAVARGDHEPDVGDVRARRVRVAREGEPTDQRAVALVRDDDRAGWAAADGSQIPALVGNAPRPRVREQPPLR